MAKYSLITLIFLFLSACSSMDAKGPQFSKHHVVSEDKALIYLLKPDSASQDGVTTCLTLKLGETEHGCVKGKGYIVAEVDAGEYKVALVNKAGFGFRLLEFELEILAGEVIYLEYAFGRDLNAASLDTRFAGLGFIISGSHVIAKIKELEALNKLSGLLLSQ